MAIKHIITSLLSYSTRVMSLKVFNRSELIVIIQSLFPYLFPLHLYSANSVSGAFFAFPNIFGNSYYHSEY